MEGEDEVGNVSANCQSIYNDTALSGLTCNDLACHILKSEA